MPSTSVAEYASTAGKEPNSLGEQKEPLLNYPMAMKYWLQVKCDLPKEILNFSSDIVANVITYTQLQDFALKCDIPRCWVERAKEDYPHNSEMMVHQGIS